MFSVLFQAAIYILSFKKMYKELQNTYNYSGTRFLSFKKLKLLDFVSDFAFNTI